MLSDRQLVNGQSYPDVNKAINNRINSGCLIFNYVGHGSETGLAQKGWLKLKILTHGETVENFHCLLLQHVNSAGSMMLRLILSQRR